MQVYVYYWIEDERFQIGTKVVSWRNYVANAIGYYLWERMDVFVKELFLNKNQRSN